MSTRGFNTGGLSNTNLSKTGISSTGVGSMSSTSYTMPDPGRTTRDVISNTRLEFPRTRITPRQQKSPQRKAEAAMELAARQQEPIEEQQEAGGYTAVKSELHRRLLDEIARRNQMGLSDEGMGEMVRDFVLRILATEDIPLNEYERTRLTDDLIQEALGVGPLASLMDDPAISDILVVGPYRVYVERFGKLEQTNLRFRDAEHLMRIIQRIAARVGRRIDESSPMVDARLPDGSRINATLPPVTIDGPTLSIRRFGFRRMKKSELVGFGMLSRDMAATLEAAVLCRKTILISGGAGAGKTTLLNAIAESIPETERVITIEDAAEMVLDQPHVVRMETRPPNIEGQGRIQMRELVINSLRMRPDRIIIGEVRGGEAFDMLQAINTGHEGSLCTVHANSPTDALSRLETMVLMAGFDLPSRAIREQIASAINLVVHVKRFEDGVRRVDRIIEVTGIDDLSIQTKELFRFDRPHYRTREVQGSFEGTGEFPSFMNEARDRGIDFSETMFDRV